MVAPSSWALIVTISEPNHITMKTVVKTWEVCFAGAFDDSINARDRHMSSGPLGCVKFFYNLIAIIVRRIIIIAFMDVRTMNNVTERLFWALQRPN